MKTNTSLKTSDLAKTACGGKLKKKEGFPSAVYNGELIYFCAHACLRVFGEHPDAFMAGQNEHPLEHD